MAVIQKASTEGPSTEQTKFHEKRALLIKLSQSVQTICQLALRADYSHAFFRVDERPERRLATHLMRLHLEFAELLQEEGALWKIVDERNDDPRCRTREEAIADVCRLLRLGGSHEVSGLPNGVLVEELFREYSRPWEGIARTYVNKVWDAVFAFLNMVLEHCIGSDISEKISQLWLSPIMSQKLNDASTKLDQLLEAHEGSLMINSPFFWRDRQRARQERKKSDIEKRLKKVFGGLGSVNRSIALAVCLDEPDMDHTLAEDTFADMNAYYDIKLKVFMDNVPTLATQAAIIRNLDAAFCPAAILDMQADKVMSIASDLVASDLQRKATTLKAPVYMPSLIEKKTPVDPLAPRTNDLKASQQPDITLEPALHCAPGSKSSLGGFQDKTVMTKNERDIEHTAGNNTPDSVKISSKQQDLNSQEAMGDGQEVQPKEFQPIHVPSLHPSITVATNGQFISSSNTFTVPSSTPSPVASPSIISPSQYKQQPTTTILPSLPASSPVQAIVESLVGPATKPSPLPRAKPTVGQANPINTNTASSTNTQWTSWEGSSTPPTVSTSKSVFGQAVFGMAPSPLAPKFSQKTGSGYVSPAGFAAFAKQNNGFNVLGASASESIFAPKSDSSAPTPRDNFGSNTFPTQTSSSTPILGSAPDANTSDSLFSQPAVPGMFGSSPGTVGGSMFRTRPNSSAPTAGGNSARNNIPPAPASYTSFTRNSSFGQPPVSGSNPFGSSPSPAQNFRF